MRISALISVSAFSVFSALSAQEVPFLNINPSWSPDGKRLVFESRRHGAPELYIINVDGSGERRLTTNLAQDTHPDWSPTVNGSSSTPIATASGTST
jgi:dipeptidyl aminopeptidase/acylaminoacyl peptidase